MLHVAYVHRAVAKGRMHVANAASVAVHAMLPHSYLYAVVNVLRRA